MDQQWIVIYVLIACVHLSYQKSTPDLSYYVAAVVEYPPKFYNDASKTLETNSDAYVKHIENASLNEADIIVFPEDGLTTVNLPDREKMHDWTTIIPDATSNYIPCTGITIKVSETLKKISCAARDNKIYVVINIAERLPCTENLCPRDKVFYYNSNVVFDRTGKIIARYRKTNLFMEPQFNVTKEPEIVTFDTDFGEKFGTFTCFDILFQEPTLNLTRIHDVTNIVFPTAWFSEAPFLTAVQTQAGWSFAENVNLLAAGYNRPEAGNAGSGIYLGYKGIGTAILPKITHEELLIYEVPKIKTNVINTHYYGPTISLNETVGQQYDSVKNYVHDKLRKKRENNIMVENGTILLKHENIKVYETFLLEGNINKTICQNGFCCDFKIGITTMDSSTKYRLVVFSGSRLYGLVEADVLACGVIQCSNDLISSCGSVKKSETVFSKIDIRATFPDDQRAFASHAYKNILVMPSTLDSDILPFRNWHYDEQFHVNHVTINIYLNNETKNIVTFGLYSRNFKNKNNANNASFNIFNYLIILSVTLLLSRY